MTRATELSGAHARASGFTLVEVLVAVAIVALGLSGILLTINGMAASSTYLRDKTLANWVAQNHVTELRLANNWPDLGESTDDAEMAGQRWRLSTEVVATPVEKLRRVNVSVAYAETPDDPLVTVAAFVGEAPVAGPRPDWRAGVPAAPGNAPGGSDKDDSGNGGNQPPPDPNPGTGDPGPEGPSP